MRTLILLLLTVIALASVAVGQNKKDKIEIGVQSTSLTIFHPDFPFDETQAGIGGRVTYNFNRSIAAEAEVNFFPKGPFFLTVEGSAVQAQFGMKVGKRFEKFGVFGKVRPGFLSVDSVPRLVPLAGSQLPPPTFDFKIERKTYFTVDAGGVLELYPSSRTVVRFEAGDTVIRHPEFIAQFDPAGSPLLIRSAKFKHNFQFTAGVGFRLGDFPDEDVQTSGSGQEPTKRFEVGAQFTSLFLEPSNPVSPLTPVPQRERTEPGFGGRFTFNLTENIAFEAEGNYFTRGQFAFPQGGHVFQGQFGAKAGKRFDKWGLFGKVRPGFVGFTEVVEFPDILLPFRFERKIYPSIDLGGVVEVYVSPRWKARFDVGDTIIRYGEVPFVGFISSFTLPGATRHNLQLSSGVGFRF
jgi:hypothetical protein